METVFVSMKSICLQMSGDNSSANKIKSNCQQMIGGNNNSANKINLFTNEW